MKQIKIIREINLKDFERTINESLSEGWELNGNFILDSENYLYQMLEKKKLVARRKI